MTRCRYGLIAEQINLSAHDILERRASATVRHGDDLDLQSACQELDSAKYSYAAMASI